MPRGMLRKYRDGHDKYGKNYVGFYTGQSIFYDRLSSLDHKYIFACAAGEFYLPNYEREKDHVPCLSTFREVIS